MLEGFKTINLTIGLPSVSVTKNGVTFSKAAVIKMGSPNFVLLMINEEQKQLAIKVCDEESGDATQFVRNNKNLNVRWNNKDFLYTLSKMMDWDLSSQGYRIIGDYISSENAMIFDLSKADPMGENDSE